MAKLDIHAGLNDYTVDHHCEFAVRPAWPEQQKSVPFAVEGGKPVHLDASAAAGLFPRTVRAQLTLSTLPPLCSCGAIERPGVVWFGESLPSGIWNEAEQAVRECDVFLVIGTSALVYPAAGLVHVAQSRGAKVIEVNPAETPLSDQVELALRAPAADVLPRLL